MMYGQGPHGATIIDRKYPVQKMILSYQPRRNDGGYNYSLISLSIIVVIIVDLKNYYRFRLSSF